MDTAPSADTTDDPTVESSAPPEALTPEPESEVHALDPSVQTVWRIKLAGAAAFLFLAALFYDLTHLFDASGWLPFGVASGVVLVGGALFTWGWPRLRYRAWGFALRPEELYREHGVLNHVRTIVPLRRIQHLDVSQDLLEREFSLGRLVVHTAGSRSSDVVIPGLKLTEAERIRDEVKRFILEDPLMEDPV
jgi:membrane protein YdbS with pleckstrin-like domain